MSDLFSITHGSSVEANNNVPPGVRIRQPLPRPALPPAPLVQPALPPAPLPQPALPLVDEIDEFDEFEEFECMFADISDDWCLVPTIICTEPEQNSRIIITPMHNIY
jgi:hypothetical protein